MKVDNWITGSHHKISFKSRLVLSVSEGTRCPTSRHSVSRVPSATRLGWSGTVSARARRVQCPQCHTPCTLGGWSGTVSARARRVQCPQCHTPCTLGGWSVPGQGVFSVPSATRLVHWVGGLCQGKVWWNGHMLYSLHQYIPNFSRRL